MYYFPFPRFLMGSREPCPRSCRMPVTPLRTLRRSPSLTLVIVASLAIGIGANTAIFSVVNALLLKPLPYPDPNRLAVLWLRSPGINIPQDWPSPGQYIDIQNENHSFEDMSISQGRTGTLLGRNGAPLAAADQAQRVEALLTSSSLFRLLGAKPLHGRLLRPEEDRPGQPPVVVLSHGCWRRAFNADPNIVGNSVTLNGIAPGGGDTKNQFEVVGVLGPDFLLNDEIMPTVASIRQMDVFMPLPFGADAVTRRGDENYNVMARLKPDVTMAQAQADVAAIAGRIREKDKRDRTFTISVVPLLDHVVGNVRRAVLVLLGSVMLVLLIACANVANLLLTRATGRQKEVAVRTALGAAWQRLVRQLLTESLMLGLLGGAAGLLVARAALQVVRTVNPGNIPRLDAITLDASVLAFTFAVSVLTGLVFGLAPALRAARVDLNTSLKTGGRNTQGEGGFGSSRRRLRSLLVVAEVAISLMLLVGAGLLVRSFMQLQNVSPGFDSGGSHLDAAGASSRQFQSRDEAVEYYRPFSDALAAVPGVTMRGAVSSLPFTSAVGWGSINVEGWTPEPGQELQVDQRAATPDYFRTMRIPLVKGRFFTDADMPQNAEPVAIIDEKFAQRFWPGGDAVGKHVWNDPKRGPPSSASSACEAVRPRRRRPHCRVPSDAQCRLPGREDVIGSGGRGRCHGAENPRAGPDDRGVQRPDDDGPDERLHGAATVLDADARRVCGLCPDSGRRGRLRRHVTPGGARRARHRRAHGSWRRANPDPHDGPAPGHGADGRRHRGRTRRRRRADARDGQPVVRRERHRSRHVFDRPAHPDLDGAGGAVSSGAACDARRSGRCVTGRVEQAFAKIFERLAAAGRRGAGDPGIAGRSRES